MEDELLYIYEARKVFCKRHKVKYPYQANAPEEWCDILAKMRATHGTTRLVKDGRVRRMSEKRERRVMAGLERLRL
jgi:hypothetical protein